MSFLTNAQEFEDAKLHWANEVNYARQESKSAIDINPWIDCSFHVVDYDVCNNVYSAISNMQPRGVLVTQWLPNECDELEAWIDTFGDPAYPDEAVEYLRVHCKLTLESSRIFRILVKAWLFDGLVRDEVRKLTESLGNR